MQVEARYPLHMVQHYVASAADAIALCDAILAAAAAGKPIPAADSLSASRRDLVPYSAAVLAEVLRAGQFESIVFSALGVREGYLYSLLDPAEQAQDPLLQAAQEMNLLRSRSRPMPTT